LKLHSERQNRFSKKEANVKFDQTLNYETLSKVKPEEIEWLWTPYIPFGMVTIMEGDPGIGKSYLAMHIAAQVTIGGELPGPQPLNRGRVLYLSAEDDPAYTIRPRIDAMGGNPRRFRFQASYSTFDDERPRNLEG
jgi:RecA-family ATPase